MVSKLFTREPYFFCVFEKMNSDFIIIFIFIILLLLAGTTLLTMSSNNHCSLSSTQRHIRRIKIVHFLPLLFPANIYTTTSINLLVPRRQYANYNNIYLTLPERRIDVIRTYFLGTLGPIL